MKKLLFSVTIKDCRVDYFTPGVHAGGGGKDTSNTGVRITHEASGAVGKSIDTRSQAKNKKLAFQRMASSVKFKAWHKLECSRRLGTEISVEERVNQAMQPENLKIEVYNP